MNERCSRFLRQRVKVDFPIVLTAGIKSIHRFELALDRRDIGKRWQASLVPTNAQAAERTAELPRPIIAELFAQPKNFSGRRIAIYGLVIESNLTGTEFLLQDVSQRPLKIVGGERLKAAAGYQLMVVGVFYAHARSPYLVAKLLIPTVVTGGEGCR